MVDDEMRRFSDLFPVKVGRSALRKAGKRGLKDWVRAVDDGWSVKVGGRDVRWGRFDRHMAAPGTSS